MVAIDSSAPIGGHFSALVREQQWKEPGRIGYESARSCIYALLLNRAPRRVYIPNYMCAAVEDAAVMAGCKVERYSLGPNFLNSEPINVGSDEIIVLANYYGLCAPMLKSQIDDYPKGAVIVDNSQAYFCPPFDVLASVYSPRKFLPVPDGGFVATELNLASEVPDEGASLRRFEYLLRRVGEPASLSRFLYRASEESLQGASLRAISRLTRNWVRAVDVEKIVNARRENFKALDEIFPFNPMKFDLEDQVPLCYPLLVGGAGRVREELVDRGVYCPHYWSDVVPSSQFELELLSDVLFLPIDHRYSVSDMRRVGALILSMGGVIR